jgi:hypothetical protein
LVNSRLKVVLSHQDIQMMKQKRQQRGQKEET